jgi:hypothetical protein
MLGAGHVACRLGGNETLVQLLISYYFPVLKRELSNYRMMSIGARLFVTVHVLLSLSLILFQDQVEIKD